MTREERQLAEARDYPPPPRIKRGRGVQPTFNERQELWRDGPQSRDALIPLNDSEMYRPEMG